MPSSIYDHTCTRCALHATAKTVCMEARAASNVDVRAMVIGEAPGRNEDEQGKPFVGRAGQILDLALHNAGLNPATMFVTNVVKCRPPGNRTPSQREQQACLPFLRDEIAHHDPRYLLALGRAAAWTLLRESTIKDVRSMWYRLDRERDTFVMVTFHPAFVDRQGYYSLARSQFMDDVQLFANAIKTGVLYGQEE